MIMAVWDNVFQRVVKVLWFLQGYFNHTVMYYGGYSNGTLVGPVEYNMQLAYFFTIAVYMVLCGIALIFRSVRLSASSWSSGNNIWCGAQYFGFAVHFLEMTLLFVSDFLKVHYVVLLSLADPAYLQTVFWGPH